MICEMLVSSMIYWLTRSIQYQWLQSKSPVPKKLNWPTEETCPFFMNVYYTIILRLSCRQRRKHAGAAWKCVCTLVLYAHAPLRVIWLGPHGLAPHDAANTLSDRREMEYKSKLFHFEVSKLWYGLLEVQYVCVNYVCLCIVYGNNF